MWNFINSRKFSSVLGVFAVTFCAVFAGADFATGHPISGSVDLILSLVNSGLTYSINSMRDKRLKMYEQLMESYEKMLSH